MPLTIMTTPLSCNFLYDNKTYPTMVLHFLLLNICLLISQERSCRDFYDDKFISNKLNHLIESIDDEHYFYTFTIKNSLEIRKIQVYKNVTGNDIFSFAKVNDKIIKNENELSIIVVKEFQDGSLEVKRFPNLCDDND